MEYRLTFRPARESSGRLPLSARSVGHFVFDRDFSVQHGNRNHHQIYWCLGGEGVLRLNGEKHRLRRDQLFYYSDHDFHDLYSCSPEWHLRVMTFDGPAAGAMVEALEIRSEPRPLRECPHELFEQLHLLLPSHSLEDERKASLIAYDILLKATLPPLPESDVPERMRQVIELYALDPTFGVEQVSEDLGVHRTTLFRNFKQVYGISPSAYLSRVRLNHALELIHTTDRTFSEIATESGFSDLSYFGKVVRRATGVSPSELRA